MSSNKINDVEDLKDSDASEVKGKSWRRERRQQKKADNFEEADSKEENPCESPDAEAEADAEADVLHTLNKKVGAVNNPKDWGKGWDKNANKNGGKWNECKESDDRSNIEQDVTKTEEKVDGTVEENVDKSDEEIKLVQDYICDTIERTKYKTEMRMKNFTSESRPEEKFFSMLDSSLKKNTAFVKKLRNMTEAQRDSLIKDFQGLNLSKYISEAAAAIADAKLKLSDVNCAVVICSLLHQRYAEFSSLLLENWQKVLPLKKEEKIINPSKVRVDLRFFAELISHGVFTQKEGLPILGNLLTVLTAGDKEEHKNSNIILSFCKHCGEDYARLLPRNIRVLSEKHNIEIRQNSWLPVERQKGLKSLLKDYYKSLGNHLVSEHKNIHNFKKHNLRILRSKGELSPERKEKYEALQEAYQKLLSTTQNFADLFDEELPQLPVDTSLDSDEDESVLDIFNRFKESDADGEGCSLWEDEDTRSFYECLQNLKAVIPGILFKDSLQPSKKSSGEEEMENASIVLEEDMSKLDLVDDMITLADSSECLNDDKQQSLEEDIVHTLIPDVHEIEESVCQVDSPSTASGSSNKILLDAFLATLTNCINRDLIDKAANEFCMNLNTKPNRKKLVRSLFLVHRTRLDLLPFHSRLIATLHPCMPEVSIDLCTMLKQDFKYHVRKKDQINIESKIKTVRFIGELVKFQMFAKAEALYCLKILLLDFNHHQIEMACNLLESCGRFLFRSAESHQRTKIYLEQMMRKKSVMSLNSRYITMIENVYYYCNPPEVTKVAKKVRPPMHQYIRKLLYNDLMKTNVEKILRQFRKFDWQDKDLVSYIVKCLVASWNVRYYNIRCVANLLAGLSVYRDDLIGKVVDGVIEDIKIGLEINHVKFNQRRVSCVKFLGELYNYRMLESAVVFKLLYSFITFGVYFDNVDSELDPIENLFRIKLVCTLLDTCGQYFNSGSSKKKLDFYVDYFQRYYWYKKSQPIYSEENKFPIRVEYSVKDTLLMLRPKLKMHKSYQAVCESIAKMETEVMTKIVNYVPSLKARLEEVAEDAETLIVHNDGLAPIQEIEEEDEIIDEEENRMSEESDDGVGEDEDDDEESEMQSQDILENASGTQDTDGMLSSSQDNDRQGTVPGGPKHIQCTEDEDFMTAFDKMLADNIQIRNQEASKPAQVDITIPINIRSQKKVHVHAPIESMSPILESPLSESPKSTTSFVLMTRRGNKAQYKSLELPDNSDLVLNLKCREKAEKVEKERVKRLTLDINERQEEEDYQEMLASLQRSTLSNFNRERGKPKFYQHPKGAPDADAIFGNRHK